VGVTSTHREAPLSEESPTPEAPNRESTGPLAGVRVLEVGSVVAGPFAGRLLGDFGAEVIKIEDPARYDPLRDWGQGSSDGHHLWWTVHARNKKCITLDLRTDKGRDLFLAMVETADVVVENFRPGTLERWGLGWTDLERANPGLILARVSGYGQTGPYRERPGYASVAEAMGGLRSINGHPDQPPPRIAISLGDSLAGMVAVQGILAALLHRERTGIGQVIDVALTEACLAMLESTIPEYDVLGKVRGPSGTRLNGIAPSNIFLDVDGRWVVVAANQDSVFRRLCQAIGMPELADDPRFATHVSRADHQTEIEDIVAEWVSKRTSEEVMAILVDAGVVVGPVYDVADIVADPHFRARDMLVEHFDQRLGRDVLGPGVVPKFSATPGSVRWAGPPRPGTHNREVYTGLLGLSEGELSSLEDDSIV